jgi:hypothetical protein
MARHAWCSWHEPLASADLRSELDRNSLSYTELIATLVLVAGSTIFVDCVLYATRHDHR